MDFPGRSDSKGTEQNHSFPGGSQGNPYYYEITVDVPRGKGEDLHLLLLESPRSGGGGPVRGVTSTSHGGFTERLGSGVRGARFGERALREDGDGEVEEECGTVLTSET